MDKTDSDFIHSGYKEVRGRRIVEKNNYPYQCFELNDLDDRIDFLKGKFLDIRSEQTISYSIWSKIFKRELIEKCFGELDDDQQIGEDALCLCRCIMESKKITVIQDCYYNYIVRNESISHKTDGSNTIDHIMLCAGIIRMIRHYKGDVTLTKELTDFCLSTILPSVKQDGQENGYIRQFFLDDLSRFRGKKIALYGGGKAGKDIFSQIEEEEDIKIVCWADRKYTGMTDRTGIPLVSPADIMDYVFDLVCIAVSDGDIADEIRDELVKNGFDDNKVLWQKPGRFF